MCLTIDILPSSNHIPLTSRPRQIIIRRRITLQTKIEFTADQAPLHITKRTLTIKILIEPLFTYTSQPIIAHNPAKITFRTVLRLSLTVQRHTESL